MPPYQVRDLFLHRQFNHVEGGPAHRRLAFTVTRALEDEDGYGSEAWWLDAGGKSRPRRLTPQFSGVASLKFDPRGERIALLGTGGQGRRLHVVQVNSGESRPVHGPKDDPESIEGWSPDGRRLLMLVSRPWSEDGGPKDSPSGAPRVVNFLPSRRDGEGWLVGRRIALVEVDVESGEERTLVAGDFDVADAQWSPDGGQLAFVRNHDGRQRHVTELWVAAADGSQARRLSPSLAAVSGPRWSPDGRRIAFAGSEHEGDSLDNLWLVASDGGAPSRPAGADLQLEGSRLAWHADGGRVAVMATRRGLIEACVVHLEDGKVQPLRQGLRHVLDVCQSGDGLAAVMVSMRRPCELYTLGWNGGHRRRRTRFNRDWSSQRTLPKVRKRRFQVPDGEGGSESIEAWVLQPPGAKGPMPLLVDLHGGPQSIALIDFASHQYWYPLLSQGWTVVAPNTVGSSSYGAEFAKRLSGRWGELDLPQVEAVVDQLQEEGLADARVCITGKSYGGYLTAWATTQTRRFRAAVVSAPVINVESHAGTSDSGYYVTPYAMDGEREDIRERYRRLSPLSHSEQVTTPTLLLQGDEDRRCPLGQSEEWLAALVRCEKAPCRLVVYPGGSHGLAASGKPSHRIDYHQRLVDWVRQWGEATG